MPQQRKGPLQRWRDWLQARRNWILYAAAVLTLFGTAAGWTMLPDQVVIWAGATGELAEPVARGKAVLGNLGLTTFFGLLFWIRPREIIYFIALCLGELLVYSLLIVNLAV